MEVEFNPGLNVNTEASQSVARQKKLSPADNAMSFERTQTLQQVLSATPQTRPEAVTRANTLAADENYPSDEALNKIAGLLADKLSGEPS